MNLNQSGILLLISFFLFSGIEKSLAQDKSVQKKTKPNIIFILTDDQPWDAWGYAGNKIIQTPEMHKLAQSGV